VERLRRVAREATTQSRRARLLVVGPERGLEPGEREELGPAARIGVGPHVLRSETAALAAAAVLALWRKET